METFKTKLENLKNFPIEKINKKDSYIIISTNDNLYQGIIKEIKSNNKFEANYLISSNKLENKINLTNKDISFFGTYNLPSINSIREIYLNEKFNDIQQETDLNLMILNKIREIYIDINQINSEIEKLNINEKKYKIENLSELEKDNPSLIIQDENGKDYNITGYYTMQFFSGLFIDLIVYINNKLSKLLKDSTFNNNNIVLNADLTKIIHIWLNLIIFVLSIAIKYSEHIKQNLQLNRKIILIDKISSILASLEIILSNALIVFCYRFYDYNDIEQKLVIISQLCYDLLINHNNNIPTQLFLCLINFITYEDNMVRIINFDKNKVYTTFTNMIQNLTETDIKYIKNFSEIKISCINLVKRLYNKEINVLINNCYYNFLINSLTKSNILEKKIGALNFINDIIINMFEKEHEINQLFYDFFFNKNKILNVFFEETVHNEILKRSIELFKYLSTYDKLENELINKLIKLDNNNNIIVRNILCEIIKRIKNAEKKTDLFMKITKDFNFDDNNNQNNIIDFVTKLTLACFYSQENKADLENDVTNGYSDFEDSFSNKNDIIDNISFSKKSNIQIVKLPGMMKNNTSFKNGKISRNISIRSMERINNDERRENMRLIYNRKTISKRKYYYGLDMFFKYILYTYDAKKALANNNLNISKAIRAFKYILDSTNAIKINDIYHFLKELLENIQTNKKHDSVVQSLILIEILLNKLQKGNNDKNSNAVTNNKLSSISNINEEENQIIIRQLDEKYNIITLISGDLIRYVNEVNEKKKGTENYKENIFEGIYNYMDNISIRLRLLFIFIYFDLNINEEHIKKLYNLFKGDEYKEERTFLFKEISNNIYYIKNATLNKIFTELFQNNAEFDRGKFEDVESFIIIRDLFIAINLIKHSLLDDLKAIKVNAELNKIEGIDYLFDILITNRSPIIIQRLCNMLSHYCFYLSSYKRDFPSKYWTSFINKITSLMEECNSSKNIEGIYALAKLTESIYHFNFSWRIPGKEDVHEIGESYSIFQFSCPDRGNKSYKLKVGKTDKLHQMRWKLAYYFDLYVNDVIIVDLDDNKYNLLHDDSKFYDLFPPRKYNTNGVHLKSIKVYEEPNQLLSIQNNPCELIESNEKIINILIDNLKEGHIDNDIIKKEKNLVIKKEIWNILENLPKQKYTELLINKFDVRKSITDDDLKDIINFDEIFVLTYNLQCFISFLCSETDKEKDAEKIKQKNDFLNLLVNIYHIDKILYSDFTTKEINKYLNNKNTQFIYFEYIKQVLIIIQILEEYKQKKNILFMSIDIKYDNLKNSNIHSKHEMDLDMTKLTSMNDLKGSILDIIGYKVLFDKLTDIIIFILNDVSSENDGICFQIMQEIIKLVDLIKSINNIVNNNYFEFIFEADILFKKIFIYDFIKCQKDEVKNLLSDFLLKNLFESNTGSINLRYNLEEDNDEEKKKGSDYKNLKIFFDIILSPEIFSFLVNNQKDGSYFNLISSMIEKYLNNKKKIINIQNTQKDIKKIIELILTCLKDKDNIYKIKDVDILNYPYTQLSHSLATKEKLEKNKNDFINGILLYLLRILELSEDCHPLIDYFLSSIDVCNFFLIKGILNKCNKKSLYSEETPYSSFNSHKIIFQILIFILKYLHNNKKIIENKKYLEDSLYIKIWHILNKYHKLEFWKKSKDFEMNFNDRDKKEFVGLRNMSSTCYMNSIIQQFFMIPILRETILNISTDKQDSILYQLQLTFSALKTYEFKYYDPKYFVTVSDLSFFEQMDADEYYGLLVDKLETDINDLNKEKNNISSKNYQNLFKLFFGIKLTDELYFIECNHKRYNESLSYNIQLEVKNYNNIEDSLKNYFKTEIMSGDNKIICEECKIKRVCHKKIKLKTLPNILVISLKRFDYDYKTMTKFKLNNYFEFPFELNMSEFLINKNESEEKNKNNLYELTGITIHYGVSDYGHYYDLIKASNNKWYKFNDTNITDFSENDIPKEAFGDKESENVDLEEVISDKAEIKEKENKNAYILIYTKKGFNNNYINNTLQENNEYNIKLVFPPYNKMSNINPSMKSYINYKMFKYWTLENLADSNYQNFILELLKLDLVKNINKEISIEHSSLIDDLKKGGYLPIKNYINTGITIFSFGLLYYCNILARSPKEKNIVKLFQDILIVYLENDLKKCVYVLEEFSISETIDEFIFYCNKDEVKTDIIELISNAFNILFEYQENNEEIDQKYINILVKYINIIILFIEKKKNIAIHNLNYFDNIAQLFYKLVYKKKIYMSYLKKNTIDKWLDDIMIKIEYKQNEAVNTLDNHNNEEDKTVEDKEGNNNINEKHFPKLESNHCLLREKAEDFNFGFKFDKNIEIKALKSKIIPKKSYDGIAFMKMLLEDLREIK